MKIRVCAQARGPLVVECEAGATIELVAPDGSPVDVSHLRKVRLCRCGASEHRPLCDGAHNRIGFEAPPAESDASAGFETEADTDPGFTVEGPDVRASSRSD